MPFYNYFAHQRCCYNTNWILVICNLIGTRFTLSKISTYIFNFPNDLNNEQGVYLRHITLTISKPHTKSTQDLF